MKLKSREFAASLVTLLLFLFMLQAAILVVLGVPVPEVVSLFDGVGNTFERVAGGCSGDR